MTLLCINPLLLDLGCFHFVNVLKPVISCNPAIAAVISH
jgi:hypothetical protein